MSAEFVKQMTDVLVAVLSMLDEAGYDTTDIEIELNEICSDYVDDAGNGFAEFRRMLDEEHLSLIHI